jgi:D-3-phosphoglycerate dehydrogenase
MSARLRRVLFTDTDLASFEIEEEVLRPLGAEIKLAASSDEATLIAEAAEAAVIVVDRAKVSEPVIASAASGGCRAIVRYGIGYDNLDLLAAERHGIPVANVPDYCLDEVADHTIALLLAHARRIIEATASLRAGGWRVAKGLVPRLVGQHLGLVGLGRIGRRVAARAAAFGLVVVAYDPMLTKADESGIEMMGTLEELYEVADYISLHLPLSAETTHLIDERALWAMRRKPLLINTSRGGLLDLALMTRALDDGVLSGLALDVFEHEPVAAEHPIRSHPLAILTPHMAYYSNKSERDLARQVAEEVARALGGEPLLNPLTSVRLAAPRS